eukprot:gene3583-13666_t
MEGLAINKAITGLVSMGYRDLDVLRQLAAEVQKRIHSFQFESGFQVGFLLLALMEAKLYMPKLMDAATSLLLDDLPNSKLKAYPYLLQPYAFFNHPCVPLQDAIHQQLLSHLHQPGRIELFTLYQLATVGQPYNSGLLNKLCVVASASLDRHSPSELCALVETLAEYRHVNDRLAANLATLRLRPVSDALGRVATKYVVCDRLAANFGKLKSRHVSDALGRVAKLGHNGGLLYPKVAMMVSQELSAHPRGVNQNFLNPLGKHWLGMRYFHPVSLFNLSHALTTLGAISIIKQAHSVDSISSGSTASTDGTGRTGSTSGTASAGGTSLGAQTTNISEDVLPSLRPAISNLLLLYDYNMSADYISEIGSSFKVITPHCSTTALISKIFSKSAVCSPHTASASPSAAACPPVSDVQSAPGLDTASASPSAAACPPVLDLQSAPGLDTAPTLDPGALLRMASALRAAPSSSRGDAGLAKGKLRDQMLRAVRGLAAAGKLPSTLQVDAAAGKVPSTMQVDAAAGKLPSTMQVDAAAGKLPSTEQLDADVMQEDPSHSFFYFPGCVVHFTGDDDVAANSPSHLFGDLKLLAWLVTNAGLRLVHIPHKEWAALDECDDAGRGQLLHTAFMGPTLT